MHARHRKRLSPPGCPKLPPVIGHRGAAAHAPENTLASLRMARRLGCAWVEFDVRLTADGALVLCHDPRLDRTTSGAGEIAATTLDAVRRCDAGFRFGAGFRGEKVPILEEALALAAELGLGADIEMKADRGRDYATAAAVADALRRLQGRGPPVLASSFQTEILDALRRLAPEIPRAVLFRRVPRAWAEIALRLQCAVIGADHRRLTRRLAVAIRVAGWPLAAYTVNDPARARLLFTWGVTSVFTDVPDIISTGSAGAVPAPPSEAAPQGSALARQGAIG
ncbi:MAG TPA: glycerophosphodiester phosphodiesterase family protein [Stellaceae bacterium]|nr:glycerophosphodiester phosphodiesterase family protein [Stellaceae bacterium]